MKCCCQQAVWGELSAVWSGVDEDCSKIKRRMESNGEAQIARTPQRQAKQQGDQASRGPVRPALVRFREIVKRAEEESNQICGGPEADALRQDELRVATEKVLLREPDGQGGQQPKQ